MKKLVFFLCLFFLTSPVFAAGFQNPWEEGQKNKFVNPWEKQKQTNQQSNQQQKQQLKQQPKTQKENSVPKIPNQIDKNTKIPSLPGQTVPQQKTASQQKQAKTSSLEKTPGKSKTKEISIPDTLTPFGIEIGDKWHDARSGIGSMSFYSLGNCGDGELFIDDPLKMCAMFLLSGKSKKLVSGGSFVIDKRCLDNTKYANWASWALNKEGTETAEYIEYSKNSASAMSCPNKNPTVSSKNLPKFLGFITHKMDRNMVGEAIKILGGKKTKEFSNGDSYDLNGTDIVAEFCHGKGDMLSIALRVNKPDSKVQQLIDMTNIERNTVIFDNAIIRTKRDKDGNITHMEFAFTEAKKACANAI